MSITGEVTGVVKNDLSWLQRHERLIIVLFCLLTVAFCFNKYVNYDAAKKEAQLTAATIQTQEALAQKQIAANAVTEESKRYQAMISSLESENKVLISTIQNDNLVLQARQKEDASLNLSDLSHRWETLVGIGITPSTGGVNVTSPAAHETVSQLESVPVLKAEVQKGSEIIENKETLLAQANILNLDLTKEVKSDTLLIQSKDKECQSKVASLKADDRKSKRNWFLRGAAVAGATVAYVFLHFGI